MKEGGGAFDGGADTVVDMAGGIREKGSALGNMGVAGTGSEFSWEDVSECKDRRYGVLPVLCEAVDEKVKADLGRCFVRRMPPAEPGKGRPVGADMVFLTERSSLSSSSS